MNIYLGNKDNENVYEDLNTLNNVLLAGGPGGGKTVYFSRLLKELTSEYSPDDLRFVIYDSKAVDYFKFRDSPYLLFPITTDTKIDEFKKQFEELKKLAEERRTSKITKPAIIVLIDEFYMLSYWFKECAGEIIELANVSNETNIHFFIASQRPNNLGKQLIKAIDNKICYWLFDEKESKSFIGASGGQDLKMSGEVITLVNGKLEKLQQKPFGDKMYL